jgi:hypothetical protein
MVSRHSSHDLLPQQCGNFVTNKAEFPQDTFNKIAEEAAVLAIHKKKRTISTREIIAA